MPTLTVNVTKQKVKVNNDEEMYIAHLKSYSRISFDEIIRMTASSQSISEANIASAFYALAATIKRYVLEGHVVDLGPIGTFRASINCTAEKNREDLSPKNVTRRRIIFHPSSELKDALYQAKVVGFHEGDEKDDEELE